MSAAEKGATGAAEKGGAAAAEAGVRPIVVTDAYENNLKHVSLTVPKYKVTAFTGVSGSGKSSLVIDTIAASSRRELNDTFPAFVQHYLPKYGRPHVGAVENLPAAIVIDQKKPAPNQRSTVGTYTDTYTLLRLLFSRVGKPFVGYSDVFSFNHPSGCCPRCNGLGEINELDVHKFIDFDKSLNDEGLIHYVAFEPGQWRWIRYALSGFFDLDKKIRDYTPEELDLFLYSPPIKATHPLPGWPKSAKYEGVVHRMYRSVLNSEEGKRHRDLLDPVTVTGVCPDCGGTRLSEKIRSCKIDGLSIADVSAMPLADVLEWLQGIEAPLAEDIKRALATRISALIEIGLGYLTLDRGLGSLSGGEAQRCKIAKYLNSSLCDLLYILDEPSVGLHSHDIAKVRRAVARLRDHGNTVFLVEHHREMIAAADNIVDIGPAAGERGGQVLFQGTYDELMGADTPTGAALRAETPLKEAPRRPSGWYALGHAGLHNLKDVDVRLPLGVMCCVVGVAGSGKSSLMEAFCRDLDRRRAAGDEQALALGEPVYIGQRGIGTSLRSTPATYMGVADRIRSIFAKRCGKSASLFSFNGKGKCPVCGGKGVIVSNMAFMDNIETVCEACGGKRYSDEALAYTVDGLTIAEVMDLTVEEAHERFAGTDVAGKLEPLMHVGLSYLHLNQALSTLSGGELQRMKLASHLGSVDGVLIMDEPTDGLHLDDIRRFIDLMDELVDRGNSVFIVEHSLDVLKRSDYAVEMGPGGGDAGGEVLFCGEPAGLKDHPGSVTGPYL